MLTKTEKKQQRSQKKDVEAEILRNIDEEVILCADDHDDDHDDSDDDHDDEKEER